MNRRSFSSRIDSNVEFNLHFGTETLENKKKLKFTFYEFHFELLIKNPKSCRFISAYVLHQYSIQKYFQFKTGLLKQTSSDGVQFDPFIDNETQAVAAAFLVVVVVVTDETVTVDILNNTKSFCSL